MSDEQIAAFQDLLTKQTSVLADIDARMETLKPNMATILPT